MPAVPSQLQPRDLVARAPQTAETSASTTTSTGSVTTTTSIATTTPNSSTGHGGTTFTSTPTRLAGSSAVPSTPGSTTSDTPFFPGPTITPPGDDQSLQHTKGAVESVLVAVAVVLVLALVLWRIVRLRRSGRSLREFFNAHPQPDVPPRPREVPRTTGLPYAPAPPVSVIYDTLAVPVPLLYRGDILPFEGRRRGRRTRAGDVDSRGRRGDIAHPDDPEEFLPEYDDKDILPRYQDVQRGSPSRIGTGMGGMGIVEGRSPNGAGEVGDTISLVTRMQLSSTVTLDDGNPQGPSSAGSHEGRETHDDHNETQQRTH